MLSRIVVTLACWADAPGAAAMSTITTSPRHREILVILLVMALTKEVGASRLSECIHLRNLICPPNRPSCRKRPAKALRRHRKGDRLVDRGAYRPRSSGHAFCQRRFLDSCNSGPRPRSDPNIAWIGNWLARVTAWAAERSIAMAPDRPIVPLTLARPSAKIPPSSGGRVHV